eukprot:TRINITY_DN1736_c0_g1_i2.p1 TRINITY_DN1736_c0_g1~~TRINITY_DN1736_c0_g1_i2.p1  ORF type:complete len:479 (+),score=97.18 TRINITY_DN1736_c0_g1_i2:223-1659(+)
MAAGTIGAAIGLGFCVSLALCAASGPEVVGLLGEVDELSESLGMDQGLLFHRFIQRHQKQYTREEYHQREAVFRDNLKFVREWNAEGHPFKVGLNAMADLTDQEWADLYLDRNIENEYMASNAYKSSARFLKQSKSSRSLLQAGDEDEDESEGGKYDVRWHKNTGSQPEAQDWSSRSVLTRVDNQAKCFACYAFSACGAIEAAVHINGGELVKLSAQQIVDCSDEYRNHRCKGGTMVKSYKYIADHSLMRDADYGYNSILNSQPQCKSSASRCKYSGDQTVQGIVGYVNVVQGNERDIMNAVSTRPVSAAIDAHHRPFKLYSSGVFSLASCTSHLTHGLLIVGYGTDTDGTKYWKVKNSWGDSWGHSGYGKVARGVNMCSIGDWANYPIVDQKDALSVSAVRTLAELGEDHAEPQERASESGDERQQSWTVSSDQPVDSYSGVSNGGYETPWSVARLQEGAEVTGRDPNPNPREGDPR